MIEQKYVIIILVSFAFLIAGGLEASIGESTTMLWYGIIGVLGIASVPVLYLNDKEKVI